MSLAGAAQRAAKRILGVHTHAAPARVPVFTAPMSDGLEATAFKRFIDESGHVVELRVRHDELVATTHATPGEA